VYIIEDVAPAYGPETGVGDFLFIAMGILVLSGLALFIFRKKLVFNR
jgi:LPXTG-motif cell wall-anchored protein